MLNIQVHSYNWTQMITVFISIPMETIYSFYQSTKPAQNQTKNKKQKNKNTTHLQWLKHKILFNFSFSREPFQWKELVQQNLGFQKELYKSLWILFLFLSFGLYSLMFSKKKKKKWLRNMYICLYTVKWFQVTNDNNP